MVRRSIIAGNWKMHKTMGEAIDFVTRLQEELGEWEETEVVVAPPFTALALVAQHLQGGRVSVAAQDVFWEENGAYTGEVSPRMVQDAGCRYVIVGHSERRQYFGETDEMVNKKVKAALAHDLQPIICVGESLGERERRDTIAVVERQVSRALRGVDTEGAGKVLIAYEPIWAIGTGKTAFPEQAQEVHSSIRGLIGDIFNQSVAKAIRIQYGGSVKPDTIDELMMQPDIDGALVGGASLELVPFVRIVKFNRR